MKLRVLVVDDEAAIRRSLRRAFEREGHRVMVAASGEDACELLNAHTVDLVLLDLHMPGMSGATVYHVIATQWPVLAHAVIVMTGDVHTRSDASWLTLNRVPHLAKPFSLQELFEAVDRLLPDQSREANGS